MGMSALREYAVLVKHMSFSGAAKELYIAQSTLSTHISKLERELGFTLVNRGNPLTLTVAGTLFYESAQTILREYDGVVARCMALSAAQVVRVRVTPSTTINFAVLSQVKGIPFVMVEAPFNEHPLDMVSRELADVAFDYDLSLDEGLRTRAEEEGIELVPVGISRLDITVMKTNPLARKGHLTREDIRGATVYTLGSARYSSWSALVTSVLGEDLGLSVELHPTNSLSNLSYMDFGNALGVGGGGLSASLLAAREDVVTFDLLDGKPMNYAVVAVYKKDNLNPNLQALIKQLQERAAASLEGA